MGPGADDSDGVLGRLSGERPRRLGRERPGRAARPSSPPAVAPPPPVQPPPGPQAPERVPTADLVAAGVQAAGELARISVTLYGRLLRGALGLTRGSRRSGS